MECRIPKATATAVTEQFNAGTSVYYKQYSLCVDDRRWGMGKTELAANVVQLKDI